MSAGSYWYTRASPIVPSTAGSSSVYDASSETSPCNFKLGAARDRHYSRESVGGEKAAMKPRQFAKPARPKVAAIPAPPPASDDASKSSSAFRRHSGSASSNSRSRRIRRFRLSLLARSRRFSSSAVCRRSSTAGRRHERGFCGLPHRQKARLDARFLPCRVRETQSPGPARPQSVRVRFFGKYLRKG